jgi:hypothetical protein
MGPSLPHSIVTIGRMEGTGVGIALAGGRPLFARFFAMPPAYRMPASVSKCSKLSGETPLCVLWPWVLTRRGTVTGMTHLGRCETTSLRRRAD